MNSYNDIKKTLVFVYVVAKKVYKKMVGKVVEDGTDALSVGIDFNIKSGRPN